MRRIKTLLKELKKIEEELAEYSPYDVVKQEEELEEELGIYLYSTYSLINCAITGCENDIAGIEIENENKKENK